MIPQMIRVDAVYENGVLRPLGPVTNLAEGDRVEAVLVRVAPIDADAPSEVERRERAVRAFEEYQMKLAALAPDPDDDYDVVAAMNATRLANGERPLIPPTEAK